MAVRALFPVRFDGSLHGRFARVGEIVDFDRDFLDRRVFVAYGVAVDGVPSIANAGNDFRVLSDYLDCYQHSGVYRDTAVLAENFAKKA